MTTKQQLESNIQLCKTELAAAEQALVDFMELPENNIFDDMDTAESILYEILRGRARQDCEGSYCCGNKEYSQKFMVGEKTYEATMTLEYNRHDKTYYYIDEITSFEVKEIT